MDSIAIEVPIISTTEVNVYVGVCFLQKNHRKGAGMLEKKTLISTDDLRFLVSKSYRTAEFEIISQLIQQAILKPEQLDSLTLRATTLVEHIRSERKKITGIDSFLAEYSLSTDEGIALMCLAEAMLRVPDTATADSLIKDKLACGDWQSHQGKSASMFVNSTTWALMLTGNVLSAEKSDYVLWQAVQGLFHRAGERIVRLAVDQAMQIMSKQFVMGRTIAEALKRSRKKIARGYLYSYDMLGEAAITAEDATRYFDAYAQAINSIGACTDPSTSVHQHPGISIKLSALHPRYQEAQHALVMQELVPKLLHLAQLAKQYNIGLTIDAEESERLELSLDVIESVFKDASLADWNGFGLAVQSYQKRAFALLDWLADLAKSHNRRIAVRLIKGAYWDSEIKKTQVQGLSDYPVFTRKVFTDVSFQACAKKLFSMTEFIYPQFATHNAYSVALILELAGDYRDFEFQCLHGMGNELYEQIVPENKENIPCRIYAPVGTYEALLPYLVRRLLENGANSSFVNRIVDDLAPISQLVADPVSVAEGLLDKINGNIPLPGNLFLPDRKNSAGIDFTDRVAVTALKSELDRISLMQFQAKPFLAGKLGELNAAEAVISPQKPDHIVGHIHCATAENIETALAAATAGFSSWSKTSVHLRAECLVRLADLYQENMPTFLALACLEAGKTLPDGVAEVREAIDFCRYYAALATEMMSEPVVLRGYTGELNTWSLHPRGVILCISPWNFPLAIFTGQVVAALVTGNCVIAKPAEQTPLIAYYATKLMLEAGIPESAVQFLPGTGLDVGAKLVADLRINGVIFTGSTQTANVIQRVLALRGEEIIPLIAETGGQNAMIVDSSALLEQVIMDVVASAFGSAGQRCSSLRVLYVQEEVYSRLITMLKGAMAELEIGDPGWLSTDVGPVIDPAAHSVLQDHVLRMQEKYEIIYQCALQTEGLSGYFMPPTAIAIDNIDVLDKEVFGPILHVISYKRKDLDRVIADINATKYGLTLGIHTRITPTAEYIRDRVHVGNCYVNRNQIGAVVGVQPFGGEGRSGTGPKAGGPLYLQRLCHERTYTVDTTAAGGNASLLAESDY